MPLTTELYMKDRSKSVLIWRLWNHLHKPVPMATILADWIVLLSSNICEKDVFFNSFELNMFWRLIGLIGWLYWSKEKPLKGWFVINLPTATFNYLTIFGTHEPRGLRCTPVNVSKRPRDWQRCWGDMVHGFTQSKGENALNIKNHFYQYFFQYPPPFLSYPHIVLLVMNEWLLLLVLAGGLYGKKAHMLWLIVVFISK